MRTLDQIRLPDHERAAIVEAAQLVKKKFPVQQVILFGSKARGDSDQESDIDLLFLTDRELDWDERMSQIQAMSPVQDKYRVFFGTINITEEEWYHGVYQVLPLRTEIERDGVLI